MAAFGMCKRSSAQNFEKLIQLAWRGLRTLWAVVPTVLTALFFSWAGSSSAIGIGTDISACVPGTCPTTYTAVGVCGSFTGRDNGYAIYTGGNYTITDGAEAEGRIYVSGNLVMNKPGLFNAVQVGVGSCVVPVNSNMPGGVPHLIVGGNLQRNAGTLSVGDPNLVSDVLAAGTISGAGAITTSGTVTASATIPPAPESFASLQTKSTFWATLPANGTISDDGFGTYVLTGDGSSALQVFNVTVPSSGLWGPSFGNSVTFAGVPANATVLINVTSTSSSITMRASDFVSGPGQNGFSFSTDLTRRILWNFPSATSVTFGGLPQWQGSVLVPGGDVTMSVPGFNGRMIVGGNLTQNCSGCEFHNYDFKGDLPAPAGITCTLTLGAITPTACSPTTNTYGVTVNFSYTNPPSGETVNLGVTGAANQSIAQPGTSATFTGLTADGALKTVTAAFSGGTCTASPNGSFTAPTSCAPTTTNVSGRVYREASTPANTTDDGNAVDPGLVTQVALTCTPAYTGTTPINTNADGTYTFTNVPTGATCTITETQPSGFANAYITPGATTGSPSNPAETPGSTGNSVINIIVPSTGSPGNNFAEQLIPTPSCSLSIVSAVPTACAPATNTYGVTVTVSYTNPPSGETVNVGVIGATNQSITQPGTSATFTGLTADGALKTVTAAFSGGTCTATPNGSFTAPASCAPTTTTVSGRVYREASTPANTVDDGNATDPGLVTNVSLGCTSPAFSAGPTATNADGTYSFTNVPIGATCTITETQPVGYTNAYITPGATTGSPSNPTETPGSTGNSVINIIVPSAGSPGNNFAEQLIPPSCTLSIGTITPTACSPSTNTYGVTVNFSYTNPPIGETVNVGVTGASAQSVAQPGTSATFTGLTADGALKTVTAAFSGGTCAATPNGSFTAPASCLPTTTTVSGRVYREASTPANAVDDGNATDPGLVTPVALSCTPSYTGTTPINTNADGTYTFTNVPIGATCTITETQPAGYTNAYNAPGTGATGQTGGTAGGNADGTITLTVPSAGSTANNFAQQSADMVSSVSCTPSSGQVGTTISCTVTCTNNGPGAAVNATCSVTNAASLPGAPSPNCSPNTNLALGATLQCSVSFALAASSAQVLGGTGSANDTNGGAAPGAGNNPSSAAVTTAAAEPALPVPTANITALFAMGALLTLLACRSRRRKL
jgi:choice-of-anchor A domain-containing protein